MRACGVPYSTEDFYTFCPIPEGATNWVNRDGVNAAACYQNALALKQCLLHGPGTPMDAAPAKVSGTEQLSQSLRSIFSGVVGIEVPMWLRRLCPMLTSWHIHKRHLPS